jgi:tetratricopeptide (TPR) repeat protein
MSPQPGERHRERGALDRALSEADHAITTAEGTGDETLFALTLRGRAEIRIARCEPELARRDLERIREIRSRLPDPVSEAEDLRVLALISLTENQVTRAEKALREVIGRAELHGRLLLVGEAARDLAMVLRRAGRPDEAGAAALSAKAMFARIGAEGEIRKLAALGWDDEFAAELRGPLAPIHVAQQYADAGRYAELLTYLEQRSKDELEESAMLTLFAVLPIAAGLSRSRPAMPVAQGAGAEGPMMEVRALNVCGDRAERVVSTKPPISSRALRKGD